MGRVDRGFGFVLMFGTLFVGAEAEADADAEAGTVAPSSRAALLEATMTGSAGNTAAEAVAEGSDSALSESRNLFDRAPAGSFERVKKIEPATTIATSPTPPTIQIVFELLGMSVSQPAAVWKPGAAGGSTRTVWPTDDCFAVGGSAGRAAVSAAVGARVVPNRVARSTARLVAQLPNGASAAESALAFG